jgi:hypothetical protein
MLLKLEVLTCAGEQKELRKEQAKCRHRKPNQPPSHLHLHLGPNRVASHL